MSHPHSLPRLPTLIAIPVGTTTTTTTTTYAVDAGFADPSGNGAAVEVTSLTSSDVKKAVADGDVKIDEKPSPWKSICDKIEPFDLVFFHGNDAISDMICLISKIFTGSAIASHCGVVVTADVLPGVKGLVKEKKYVLEATFSGTLKAGQIVFYQDVVPDVTTKAGRYGVQIRELDDVIGAYTSTPGARVAWGRLKNNPWRAAVEAKDARKQADLAAAMTRVYKVYENRYWNANPLDLCSTVFACCREPRNMLRELENQGFKALVSKNLVTKTAAQAFNPAEWIFCSELCVLVYQALGMVSKVTVDALNCVPEDLITMCDELQYLSAPAPDPAAVDDSAAAAPAVALADVSIGGATVTIAVTPTQSQAPAPQA